jgi:outer membrane protein assembly factor BamE (lipoprotein component of BamABCDE complex)
MSRTKKRAIIILGILAALLLFEVGREYVVYRMASNRLEGSYWKLQGRTGMTKEEVRAVLGEPDHIETGESDENWYWYSREARGPFWKMVNSGGGYELNVQFDKTGRLLDVYSKVQ